MLVGWWGLTVWMLPWYADDDHIETTFNTHHTFRHIFSTQQTLGLLHSRQFFLPAISIQLIQCHLMMEYGMSSYSIFRCESISLTDLVPSALHLHSFSTPRILDFICWYLHCSRHKFYYLQIHTLCSQNLELWFEKYTLYFLVQNNRIKYSDTILNTYLLSTNRTTDAAYKHLACQPFTRNCNTFI